MTKPKHGYDRLVGSSGSWPRTYYARCFCKWAGLPTDTKEKAYEDFADHYMDQPEVLEFLAEVRSGGLGAKADMANHPVDLAALPINRDEVLPMRVSRPDVQVASWVVGSHPSCDWIIDNDPYVSAQHCMIRRDSTGHFWVQDMGSTNGTYIRRQAPHGPADIRVERSTAILNGDQVIIGHTTLDAVYFHVEER